MEETNATETKFCQKCGKQIRIDAEFCPYCGAQQQVSRSVAPEPAAATQNQAQPVRTQTQAIVKPIWPFMAWGWPLVILGLFIPLTAIASFVLGILTIQRKRNGAGVTLLVFACIAFYLGMTGFSEGFFGAL